MQEINITPIVQAIIALLAAIITYWLLPWIKARTTKEQQENMRNLVKVLVYAAEQVYGSGYGVEKREHVMTYLRANGYKVDPEEIEAEVYKAFNSGILALKPDEETPKEEPEEPEGQEE